MLWVFLFFFFYEIARTWFSPRLRYDLFPLCQINGHLKAVVLFVVYKFLTCVVFFNPHTAEWGLGTEGPAMRILGSGEVKYAAGRRRSEWLRSDPCDWSLDVCSSRDISEPTQSCPFFCLGTCSCTLDLLILMSWKHEEEERGLWEGSKQSCRLHGVFLTPSLEWRTRARRFSRVSQAPLSRDSPVRNTRLHAPPPGDLPTRGMEPTSPLTLHWQGSFTSSAAWEAPKPWCLVLIPVVRGEDQHRKERCTEETGIVVVRPKRKALGQAVRMRAGPEAGP